MSTYNWQNIDYIRRLSHPKKQNLPKSNDSQHLTQPSANAAGFR